METGNPFRNDTSFKWANRLTGVLLVGQFLVLLAILGFLIRNQQGALFSTQSPQRVLTPRVALGSPVKVEGTKCNLTTEDLTVAGTLYWIRELPTSTKILVSDIPIEKGRAYKPGCTSATFDNKMPVDATLGTWHLEGTQHVRDSHGLEQFVSWHSDSFEITAP